MNSRGQCYVQETKPTCPPDQRMNARGDCECPPGQAVNSRGVCYIIPTLVTPVPPPVVPPKVVAQCGHTP